MLCTENRATVKPLSLSGTSHVPTSVQLGFHEIHVQARAGHDMAGGGGTAGPALSIRHQPPGPAA